MLLPQLFSLFAAGLDPISLTPFHNTAHCPFLRRKLITAHTSVSTDYPYEGTQNFIHSSNSLFRKHPCRKQ